MGDYVALGDLKLSSYMLTDVTADSSSIETVLRYMFDADDCDYYVWWAYCSSGRI